MKKHIEWIDGLKGIACVLIFTHHFLLAFLPSVYFGFDAVSHYKYDAFISQSILSLPIAGNFWVFIFCILSGFVLTIGIGNKINVDKISNGMFKRYIHFVIPLLLLGIVAFIFNKYNIFTNIRVSAITGSPWLSNYYINKLSLFDYIRIAFIDTLFFANDEISTAFWMFQSIFYGTFITYIINIVFSGRKKYSLLFLLIPFIGFFINKDPHVILLNSFIVGYLLAKMYQYIDINKHKKVFLICGIISIIVGLFLGGYPPYGIPTNYYKILTFMSNYQNHLIGASLFLLGIILTSLPQKILSFKPFVKLGKVSFEIYLVHIFILFTFSTSLFEFLFKYNNRYLVDTLIVYIISTILLILVSILFNKTITKYTKKLEILLEEKTKKEV